MPLEIPSWLNFNQEMQDYLINFVIRFGLFILGILICLGLGKLLPTFIKNLVKKLTTEAIFKIYQNIVESVEKSLTISITLLLFYVALEFIKEYGGLYRYLKLGVDFSVTLSLAFLFAGLFRNFLRIYGVNLIRKIGLDIDELLFILETVINVVIGVLAALAFAQSQNVNLVGVLAGLGIGGLAVAFAAQKTLEQIVGTLVVYLDRPYSVGEYIRISLTSQGVVLARVESIGIRSTKLRTLAKSTMIVVPNSTMSNVDIENVSRGKKIMVLLYFDFDEMLEKSEQAMLEKVVKESTNSIFGIDPNSTSIKFLPKGKDRGVRAQVSLFVLGSQGNSQEFRRQLLALANESISKQLLNYGMQFTMKEPTVYVESSVPI